MIHSHYFLPNENVKAHALTVNFKINDTFFELQSSSHVFSKDKLDTGSQLLIKTAHIVLQEKTTYKTLVDLGAGYGPVGIVLAVLNPNRNIALTFIDTNTIGLACVKKNCHTYAIKAQIVESDGFHALPELKADLILLNPPHSAGKDTCMKLITQAINHLTNNGQLVVVARKNKGGQTLANHMKEIAGNVAVLEKEKGYFIYSSIRNLP